MTSQTWQVSASTDDCDVYETGAVHPPWDSLGVLTNNYVWAGGTVQAETQYWLGSGMRFLNVTIPKDAIIDSAYLKLLCSVSKATTTVNTNVVGEAADDAATFSTIADFNGRGRTVSVAWNNIPAWTAAVEYSSPDIKTIIQAIVNRAGWSSGNDMALFWEDNGTSAGNAINRQASSFNLSAPNAPKLTVTWHLIVPIIMHHYNRINKVIRG